MLAKWKYFSGSSKKRNLEVQNMGQLPKNVVKKKKKRKKSEGGKREGAILQGAIWMPLRMPRRKITKGHEVSGWENKCHISDRYS